MALAETIESIGETGGGGNVPLPSHNTCRMELPCSYHTWPGLLTTTTITTGSGTVSSPRHLQLNQHHLHPLEALYLSYPLPYPHPEGQDEPQTHQQLPALSPSTTPSPFCDQSGERGGDISGEQSASDREERQGVCSRQGPLPDLLPQNEHPSRASAHHGAPGAEAAPELEVRRVAIQLRFIGDEFNAVVLRRAHAAPYWQDWRGAYRGLLAFITQTLSTLYRVR